MKLFKKYLINYFLFIILLIYLTMNFNQCVVLADSLNYSQNTDIITQYGIDKLTKRISFEERNKIVVAVLDTGVDMNHDALKDILTKGHNFVDETKEPYDDNGHGTEIAGIIGGISPSGGFCGIAPGVRIMPVKILDANKQGDINTEARGIIWAVDNGARVINLSMGGETPSPVEHAAIKYAVAKGAVVIAAIGNQGMSVSYPAAYEEVIAVTSIDQKKRVSFFVNHGPQVTVSAPGENIYTTAMGNRYKHVSGTSIASAFVSGVASLILAERPDLTPYEVKQLFEAGSDVHGPPGGDNYYGYGIIDPNICVNMPEVSIAPQISNNYLPAQILRFAINKENNTTTETNGSVDLDLYKIIDECKQCNDILRLKEHIVISLKNGAGLYKTLLKEPGAYEIQIESRYHEYVGNNFIFTI